MMLFLAILGGAFLALIIVVVAFLVFVYATRFKITEGMILDAVELLEPATSSAIYEELCQHVKPILWLRMGPEFRVSLADISVQLHDLERRGILSADGGRIRYHRVMRER